MSKEFHIFASDFDTRFVMKGVGANYPKEFSSLVEATRHARTQSDCEGGLVVIYDEDRKGVNRIPISARR